MNLESSNASGERPAAPLDAGKKLAFGLLTIVLLVAAAEAAARLTAPPPRKANNSPVEFVGNDRGGRFPTESDEVLFWKIPANAQIPDLRPCVEERVNSHGFRGPDFSVTKAAGVKRCVFLGDSNTFGMGVEGDETYVHRVSRWLQTAKDTKWEIINTATPGYSSFQMLKMLETRVAAFRPDIVVIYAGAWNDYTPAIGGNDEKSFAQLQQFGRRSTGIFQNLKLFQAIVSILNPAEDVARAGESRPSKQEEYKKLWSERMERPDGPRLEKEQFARILTTIAERAKALGSKIIFITPPAPFTTRSRFTDGENYARIFSDVGTRGADAVADARAALLTNSAEQDKDLFCDIIHPSPAGHARVARTLCETIQRLKIDGVPTTDPAIFTETPIDLRALQIKAEHFTGNPLKPLDAATAYSYGGPENVIIVPAPSKIIYKSLALPPNAALRAELLFFRKNSYKDDAATKPVETTHFEVRVATAGVEKVVFRADKQSSDPPQVKDNNLWAGPYAYRVDLGQFGGQTVDLIFETTGESAAASWGQPKIYAYR